MKTRLLRDIEVSEVGMGCMAFFFPRLWADTAGGIQRGSNPECLPERMHVF